MRARYYVLAPRVRIGYLHEEPFLDQHRLETVYQHKKVQDVELRDSAVLAAHQIYFNSKDFPKLHAFKTLEAAREYAKETRGYYTWYYEGTGRSYYVRSNQFAIVTIHIDTSLQHTWETRKAKARTYNDWNEEIKKVKNPLSLHEFIVIPNKPENYVMSLVSVRQSHNFPLHSNPPLTYLSFFSKNKTNVLKGIEELFNDYHSPQFGSCHWGRSYKKIAEKILKEFKSISSPQEVYNFLFHERQKLIRENKDLNMQGSFIRRMDYALKRLRDVYGDQLENDVKDKPKYSAAM